MDEPEVAALTERQRARLLHAFDTAGRAPPPKPTPAGSSSHRRKRRRVGVVESPPPAAAEDGEDDAGGGFMVDDDLGGGGFLPEADDGGGGFLPEDDGGGGGFLADDVEMDGGGGFFPEGAQDADEDDAAAGGFLPADDPEDDDVPPAPARTRLPLALVSAGLRIAGLPPSDPEVLAFFRQSAEGWAGGDDDDDGGDGEEDDGWRRGVSRKDWMSVCAVLLASRADDEGDGGGSAAEAGESSDLSEPDDVDQDEYRADADDDGLDLSNPSRRRTRRATRASARPSLPPPLPSDASSSSASVSSDDDDSGGGPSSRRVKGTGKPKKAAQAGKGKKTTRTAVLEHGDRPALSNAEKRAAREAFALFFPPPSAGGSAGYAVDDKVLTVAMVAGVVKDLKEKNVSQDLVRRGPCGFTSSSARESSAAY